MQQLAAKSSRASASPSTRSQYHPLAACSEHSPIDLLFYNVRLRCCVVMGLKNAELRPEYTGKPGSCFSTVDGELRANGDRLTNGLLLCKTKNDVVTEYSLRDINQPVGVSEYRLVTKHAYRPALIPIITVMGMQIALLLAGAVLTETTFEWKGIGFMLAEYLKSRDFVAVQGIVVMIAVVVAVTNFIVDIVAAFIDPRVRY